MPPPLLIDLDEIDLKQVLYDAEAIEQVNPQRYEMRQLDGINYIDFEAGLAVGYKDVTEKEFWVRGHVPGRPLMPGVIMLEAAAQLASFYTIKTGNDAHFVGLGGIEEVKFRSTVLPGMRLHLLGKFIERRSRRFKCAAQGVVDGQMVFEALIIGMPV